MSPQGKPLSSRSVCLPLLTNPNVFWLRRRRSLPDLPCADPSVFLRRLDPAAAAFAVVVKQCRVCDCNGEFLLFMGVSYYG